MAYWSLLNLHAVQWKCFVIQLYMTGPLLLCSTKGVCYTQEEENDVMCRLTICIRACSTQVLLQREWHDRQLFNGFSSGFVNSVGLLLEGRAIMPTGMLTLNFYLRTTVMVQ